MKRCRTCLYPDTKPDLYFDETGQCSACASYEKRPAIDWDARKQQLLQLLDKHNGRCIVPSSGGKDSTYQVIKLLELGADPLVVTATTCHLTPIGRKNIDNLARYATTIEVSPNKTVRAKLNRFGLEMVGDISWPEHASIFSTPFREAVANKIPLIFYGENPQNQYGGPAGSDEAKTMTRRWTQEYGGFLGLRPSDFVGVEGITEKQMADYELPKQADIDALGVEAHFLGQYLPWDSWENADVAYRHGMIQELPERCNWWEFENLDNAQTGIHDWFAYLKYGYGRCVAQLSVDIRDGRISREDAEVWRRKKEPLFPYEYGGVDAEGVLADIGLSWTEFVRIADQFTNWSIFRRVEDDQDALPILIWG